MNAINTARITVSNSKPMLTLREAADLMRVSTKSVQRAIDRGDLSAHRIGRSIRIATTAVENFIAPYNPANAATIEVAA